MKPYIADIDLYNATTIMFDSSNHRYVSASGLQVPISSTIPALCPLLRPFYPLYFDHSVLIGRELVKESCHDIYSIRTSTDSYLFRRCSKSNCLLRTLTPVKRPPADTNTQLLINVRSFFNCDELGMIHLLCCSNACIVYNERNPSIIRLLGFLS